MPNLIEYYLNATTTNQTANGVFAASINKDPGLTGVGGKGIGFYNQTSNIYKPTLVSYEDVTLQPSIGYQGDQTYSNNSSVSPNAPFGQVDNDGHY